VVVERIEVTHHALARTICARSGWRGDCQDDDLTDIWDEVWQDRTLARCRCHARALQEEYAWVVDPNGIADEEAYSTLSAQAACG
jgi:hypothetical protein